MNEEEIMKGLKELNKNIEEIKAEIHELREGLFWFRDFSYSLGREKMNELVDCQNCKRYHYDVYNGEWYCYYRGRENGKSINCM